MPDLSTLDPVTAVLVVAILALAKVLVDVMRGRRNGGTRSGSAGRDTKRIMKETKDDADANSREIARLDERTKLIQGELKRLNDSLDKHRRRY